jgi:hypothetical protein
MRAGRVAAISLILVLIVGVVYRAKEAVAGGVAFGHILTAESHEALFGRFVCVFISDETHQIELPQVRASHDVVSGILADDVSASDRYLPRLLAFKYKVIPLEHRPDFFHSVFNPRYGHWKAMLRPVEAVNTGDNFCICLATVNDNQTPRNSLVCLKEIRHDGPWEHSRSHNRYVSYPEARSVGCYELQSGYIRRCLSGGCAIAGEPRDIEHGIRGGFTGFRAFVHRFRDFGHFVSRSLCLSNVSFHFGDLFISDFPLLFKRFTECREFMFGGLIQLVGSPPKSSGESRDQKSGQKGERPFILVSSLSGAGEVQPESGGSPGTFDADSYGAFFIKLPIYAAIFLGVLAILKRF